MERLKTALLIVSLLGNIAAIAFILILTQTSYLDLPLAAYSHQKNCEKDFEQVLKLADKLPADQKSPAKQAFASIVCQKDYQTGRPLSDQDFAKMFQQISGQVSAPGPAETPTGSQ
jgi:hypothetical protein